MSTFDQTQDLLNTLVGEALCSLRRQGTDMTPEEQELTEYWSADDGALYMCNTFVPERRTYQDMEMATEHFQNYISKEIALEFVDYDFLLVVSIGPKFESLSFGAVDRKNLVAAVSTDDWAERGEGLGNVLYHEDSENNTEAKVKLMDFLMACRKHNQRE